MKTKKQIEELKGDSRLAKLIMSAEAEIDSGLLRGDRTYDLNILRYNSAVREAILDTYRAGDWEVTYTAEGGLELR